MGVRPGRGAGDGVELSPPHRAADDAAERVIVVMGTHLPWIGRAPGFRNGSRGAARAPTG